MSWEAVARKDFQDAIRSRTLWVVGGLFLLLAVGPALIFAVLGNSGAGMSAAQQRQQTINLVHFVSLTTGWLIPITALLVGYRSIAGERESGSIKLLLSLPHDRRDVVVGKLLGRSLIVAAAIAAGFSAAFVVSLVLFSPSASVLFLPFTAFTILFATAYVSIAVGLSAYTASSSRAAAGSFGIFALFTFVWEYVPNAIYFLQTSSIRPDTGEFPTWYVFLDRLSPNGAYDGTLLVIRDTSELQTQLGGSIPGPLTWWVALGILVLWIVAPVAIGYLRFRAADL